MTTFGPYPGTVTHVHDGDTFDVVVKVPRGKTRDIGWDVTAAQASVKVTVRLWSCNAAEIATDQGKAALAFLLTQMPVGSSVKLLSYGWDKYAGRTDAAITLADGRDLTTVMVDAGQAAAWNGVGPKPVPTPPQPSS